MSIAMLIQFRVTSVFCAIAILIPSRVTLPASSQSFMSQATIRDASAFVPRRLGVPDDDDVLCAALIGGLQHFKIKRHEVRKLSTSARNGCEQVDQAAIERFLPIVRSVLVPWKLEVPCTSQLAGAFASVDTTGDHILFSSRPAVACNGPHAKRTVVTLS